ncbi:MAG: hypothetical protein RLY93_12640 [Sumerlaeia bacterium]
MAASASGGFSIDPMKIGISTRTEPFVQPPVADRLADAMANRIQIWNWPAHYNRWTCVVPPLALLGLAVGFEAVREGSASTELEWVVGGLLLILISCVALAILAISHFVLARRIRLTHECLHITQSLRDPLCLSYDRYGQSWIADGFEGAGPIRIIVFEHHRGCTVPNPPEWLRLALAEIARIQDEEGWYPPADIYEAQRPLPEPHRGL